MGTTAVVGVVMRTTVNRCSLVCASGIGDLVAFFNAFFFRTIERVVGVVVGCILWQNSSIGGNSEYVLCRIIVSLLFVVPSV